MVATSLLPARPSLGPHRLPLRCRRAGHRSRSPRRPRTLRLRPCRQPAAGNPVQRPPCRCGSRDSGGAQLWRRASDSGRSCPLRIRRRRPRRHPHRRPALGSPASLALRLDQRQPPAPPYHARRRDLALHLRRPRPTPVQAAAQEWPALARNPLPLGRPRSC